MVSILVPVYNASRYLRECVSSLTGQTYADLQIVLINDGSTDDSWNIMQELARQDKRIEIYSQPNCGVAATRNRLLEKALGEFVLFVDSDDWIDLDTIETLNNERLLYGADMVVCNSPIEGIWDRENAVKEFLWHREFRGMLWNKLIKRVHFENKSFNETVSLGEDALMVWQIIQQVNCIRLTNRILYHYRENENSLSRLRFNEKKFSAYTTWDAISSDADVAWPQYSDIAHARFACEMTQILLDASRCGYKSNAGIELLQDVVRHDASLIVKTGISSWKMNVFAWLVSHCYWLARIISPYIIRNDMDISD